MWGGSPDLRPIVNRPLTEQSTGWGRLQPAGSRPWIIPVAGFLGAGKTTLILAAARLLTARNLKCAAILNDQGSDLVDSAYFSANGVNSSEVTGGCFCCRFSDLIHSAEQLRSFSPDVIFIEPVGSCTDLSATILQPLKREFANQYRLAPLTVVVDPTRAENLTDPNIRFLFDSQLAEADLIVYSKSDIHVPATAARSISALTGVGVAAWLDEILAGMLPIGTRILKIDYAEYARAEAALAWLNWSATLRLTPPLSPAQLIGPWLDNLQSALRHAPIAHLKIFDQTPATYLKAALTNNTGEPIVEGDLTASPATEHSLLLNLRAVIDPDALHELFTSSLAQLPGQRSAEHLQCFSPAPPQPEHRYADVVT
jgi:Ni2+-binding GTPase involved in maturation of urease and hydrogenase